MKINITVKTIVALLVAYGSSSAGSLVNTAGNLTTSVMRAPASIQNKLTNASSMQSQRGRIVQTPADQRDMSGDTMYAQPYEEESVAPLQKNGRSIQSSVVPASADEPAYKQGRRRRGTMYAS